MSYLAHLNSKKFIFALVVILINAGLMCMKLIGDGVYSTVVLATVAAYLAANVAAKQVEYPKTKV